MKFKESETLELKKSTSELKEAIISMVSILNKHQKGELYFGIKNDGTIVGQDVSDKTVRNISKTISDNIEPKIFPEIESKKLEEKICIAVNFEGSEIPYFAYGRAYIRIGNENRQLSAKELEKIVIEKHKGKLYWDNLPSQKNLKQINEKLLKEYVKRAKKEGRINFEFKDIKTTLKKVDLIKDSKLLNAAEVLFCDNNPIEVQLAIFAGKDKVKFLDIKLFKGNIFYLLEETELYIKQHINWEVEIKSLKRDEIPEIPIPAIREALVNSFCHRDYFRRENNEIAIFTDRVEIYNPGQFPEGHNPEDFIRGEERSILRNPLIAQILYYSRDIERFGSGLKRIYEECQNNNVKVEFEKLKSGFVVVFYRKKKVIYPKDTIKDTIKLLSENEQKIINTIMQNPNITIEELSKKLNINIRNTKKNIAKLKEKGLIKRIGSRKIGYWEVVK